jgi:hydrogenase expression/formation protein HypE
MTGEGIELDCGTSGARSQQLIADLVAPGLGTSCDAPLGDAVALELDVARIVVSSGAFVVDPLFFGNGDIGRLAICGAVNDLAVGGATPSCVALSFVIEQGFPATDLARVLDSVRATALEGDVEIVAADAQVVRRGEVDKLFINTTGIGELVHGLDLDLQRVGPGDVVIVTGPLGEHGAHLLALREDRELAARVLSDCAPLGGLVWNVLEDYAPQVHCLRDLARGGLASVLGELADTAGVSIEVEEHRLPVGPETRLLAQRLEVDPLDLPSAGAICMVVEREAATEVLELVRWQPQGGSARIVGSVRERADRAVTLVRPGGGTALAPLVSARFSRLR